MGLLLNISFSVSIQIGDKAKNIIVKIDCKNISFFAIVNFIAFFSSFNKIYGVIALKNPCSIDLKTANMELAKVKIATASSPLVLSKTDRATTSNKYLDDNVGIDNEV